MIKAEDWKPIGISSLETNAEKSVRSLGINLILAGPGAGKTEFLAQKALYLLQTNICPKPKRILAISYKKDSAKNLEERVNERLNESTDRFDSMTFDAFSKSILDRFMNALPSHNKISNDYELSLKELDVAFILEFSKSLTPPKGVNDYTIRSLNKYNVRKFLKEYFYAFSLRNRKNVTYDGLEWLSYELWDELLHNQEKTMLTFPMITRLAEELIFHNPLLRKTLLMTYSDLFLDEFQDTTNVQFDLLKTIFRESDVRITAVGDNKQRIMGYAMALEDAFASFQKEFGGEVFPLYTNYRSAKNLVAIQHMFAQVIDNNTILQKSYSDEERGECKVITFEDDTLEAELLSLAIAKYINKENIDPSDIVILTKMQPIKYTEKLVSKLKASSIKARVEEQYQDLLKDELIIFLINFLMIASNPKSHDAYSDVIDFIKQFKDVREDLKVQALEKELDLEIKKIKKEMQQDYLKERTVSIINIIINYLGVELVKGYFPQFKQGEYLNSILERFATLLDENLKNNNGSFKDGLEEFLGLKTVKIMSIHKSKGLEFHTVIFVGLEDSAFWSFTTQKNEDISAFYVALSRARERMLFTFCEKRNTRGFLENQSSRNINELFELLKKANVPVLVMKSKK